MTPPPAPLLFYCKRRTILNVPYRLRLFSLDFLLSLTICDSKVKEAMYTVKFPTNLGNSSSPWLFLAPRGLVPHLRFHSIRYLCRYLRPQRLRLCPEKSPAPLHSQIQIY